MVKAERYEEAEQCLKEALRIKKECLQEGNSWIGNSLKNLVKLYLEMGRWEQAVFFGEQALGVFYKNTKDNNRQIGDTKIYMAQAFQNMGNLQKATQCAQEALAAFHAVSEAEYDVQRAELLIKELEEN